MHNEHYIPTYLHTVPPSLFIVKFRAITITQRIQIKIFQIGAEFTSKDRHFLCRVLCRVLCRLLAYYAR